MIEPVRFILANAISATCFFATGSLVPLIRHRLSIANPKWRFLLLAVALFSWGSLFYWQIKLDAYVWHFYEVDQYFMANRIILVASGIATLIWIYRRISARERQQQKSKSP